MSAPLSWSHCETGIFEIKIIINLDCWNWRYIKGDPSHTYFYTMAVLLRCTALIFAGFNSELVRLASPYGITELAHLIPLNPPKQRYSKSPFLFSLSIKPAVFCSTSKRPSFHQKKKKRPTQKPKNKNPRFFIWVLNPDILAFFSFPFCTNNVNMSP